MMRFTSIVTKLWLATTLLLLLVIAAAGLAQSQFLEDIYFRQQSEELLDWTRKIAVISAAEKDPRVLDDKLEMLAMMRDANIMVVDAQGLVRYCQGMGTSTENMPLDINNPHHGPLSQADLDRMFRGETVVHRGMSDFFRTEVLSVALPVPQPTPDVRAVVIHAPLKPLRESLAGLRWVIVYTALGGGILASLLSIFFSRRISRPLIEMNRAAIAMAAGDYSNRSQVRGRDEIATLAQSLNTLAANLEEKISQLEQLDRTRREFVSHVSHEMKTPLSIVQAFTEALMDGMAKDEPERETYLRNIHDETLRLKRLVEEVLDLKRMEEGKFDFSFAPVDLAALTRRVAERMEAPAEEKGVRLSHRLEGGLPLLSLNEDRMEGVILNLVDNALRHTPAGGEVIVSLERSGDDVILKVEDTGSGIAPEELPLIWERFYKADKSRDRSKGGTGLGLAIVRKVVEAHGGRIEAASRLGEGSIFTVTLPTGKP